MFAVQITGRVDVSQHPKERNLEFFIHRQEINNFTCAFDQLIQQNCTDHRHRFR